MESAKNTSVLVVRTEVIEEYVATDAVSGDWIEVEEASVLITTNTRRGDGKTIDDYGPEIDWATQALKALGWTQTRVHSPYGGWDIVVSGRR